MSINFYRHVVTFFLLLLLCACGGGSGGGSAAGGSSGSSSSGGSAAAPAAPSPNLSYTGVKIIRISWADVNGATHYQVLENPDGASGFTQVGADIAQGVQRYDHTVTLYKRLNAQYILRSCNSVGCTDSGTISVSGNLAGSVGYFKASDVGSTDFFGFAISLSGDGNTLAVGAEGEDSNATGINGNDADNSAENAGAVYVFVRDGTSWLQQAYIKASNAGAHDFFGKSISLSADGSTLAVGATGEDSSAHDVDGDQNNSSASFSGAVYVFARTGSNWSQEAYIKARHTTGFDQFGISVSLSDNGNVLAVGADYEDSNASTVNGDESNDSLTNAGAAYVFVRQSGVGPSWRRYAYIKPTNPGADDRFGSKVSLSGNGAVLAVGVHLEDSGSASTPADNSAINSGAVYIFKNNSGLWSQQNYIKANAAGAGDYFGHSISLNQTGTLLAVGAPQEDGDGTGQTGDPNNNGATDSGAAYLFEISGTTATQQAYLKASNTSSGDQFGTSISLASDSSLLAVAGLREDSGAAGINGDEMGGPVADSGAAYLFQADGGGWLQLAFIKASNPGRGDIFGWSGISLSGNGDSLAVSAVSEDSQATGIGGDQSDNTASSAGAVYLY